MKKLFSILVAVLMAISTLPMAVSAADPVDWSAILGDGNIETFVTNPLNFAGYTPAFDKEGIINADGSLNRPLFIDETVNVTINGESRTLTVKAQTVDAIYVNGFNTADSITGWTTSGGSSIEVNDDAFLPSNSALYASLPNSSSVTSNIFPDGLDVTKDVYIECDISCYITGVGGTPTIDLDYTHQYSSGSTSSGSMHIMYLTYDCMRLNDYTYRSVFTSAATEYKIHTLTKITPDGKMYFQKSDGNYYEATNSGDLNYNDVTGIKLRGFSIKADASSNAIIHGIDNIVMYTESSVDEYVANLSEEERAETMASLITQDSLTNESAGAITTDLALDGGYDNYNLEACNVNIEWTSDNDAIAVNDTTGVVTRNTKKSENVKLTATVTAGDAVVTKDFYFTVAPTDSANFLSGFFNHDFEDQTPGSVQTLSAINQDIQGWCGSGKEMTYIADAERNSVVAKLENNGASEGRIELFYTYAGSNESRYFTHCDMKFTENKAYHFRINGPGNVVDVRFDLSSNSLYIYTRQGNQRAIYFPLPAEIEANKWFSLDVDLNLMSRSYIVYINGEQIGSIPAESVNASNVGSSPFRAIYFQLPAEAAMYIDNLSVREDSSADRIKANAAVNAAMLTYGFDRLGAISGEKAKVLTGITGLPTQGPTSASKYAGGYTAGDYSVLPPYEFSGGASITWNINGRNNVTEFIPTSASEVTFVVTAQSGSVTETGSFVHNMAPAVIDELTYSGSQLTGIKLSGSFTGKTVLVAKYTGNQMTFVKTYDAAATVDTSAANIVKGTDEEVKVFLLDKTSLLPVAYSK